MASYGAKNPYFSRIKAEPDLGLPVYDGEPIKIGRLVKSDITLTMASGTLYADDELAESAEEFIGGDIVMETDDILDSVASEIYGAKVKEKRVIYNTGDNPPPGGLSYYKKLMRRGKIFYKCLYFPRVKAALGNDTAQTKSDSIIFGTSTTKFKLYSCNNGDWRHTEEFENEADALAWVKAQLSPPPASGEDAPPSGGDAPPSGGDAPPSGEDAPPSGEDAPPSGEETGGEENTSAASDISAFPVAAGPLDVG